MSHNLSHHGRTVVVPATVLVRAMGSVNFLPQNAAKFILEKQSPAAWADRQKHEKDGLTMMNTVALHGRLTAAPEIRHMKGVF